MGSYGQLSKTEPIVSPLSRVLSVCEHHISSVRYGWGVTITKPRVGPVVAAVDVHRGAWMLGQGACSIAYIYCGDLIVTRCLWAVWPRVQVGMVGDSQTGKTGLMARYVDRDFDPHYTETGGERESLLVLLLWCAPHTASGALFSRLLSRT